MPRLEDPHRSALRTIATALADRDVPWALTGSASFVLQGVPLSPNDLDVQTTEAGAATIEAIFADAVTEPVTDTESDRIRSHYGALVLEGVRVEVMGDLQTRLPDGTWTESVDLEERREFVSLGDVPIPVLPLEYEARAYERLGRSERAALLREYAEQ